MTDDNQNPYEWEVSLRIENSDKYCEIFDACDEYLTKRFGIDEWQDVVLGGKRIEPVVDKRAVSTVYGFKSQRCLRQFLLWCEFHSDITVMDYTRFAEAAE